MSSKVLSIGGYYGGKVQSVKKILPHLPKCSTLVSPFCGFAPVELNSGVKNLVLSDANPATIAALKAIRDDVKTLISWLGYAAWDKEYFQRCKKSCTDRTDHAFYIGYAAIAYSAMAHHRGGSVSGYSVKQAEWARCRDWGYLLQIGDRLRSCSHIICRDFRWCFDQPFKGSIAYYLDPPYLDGGEHYQVTMTVDDHADMLDLAIATPYPVAISGYASQLYDERLKDWRRIEFSARNNHRQNKTEVLWVKS
jgi:DNA adenine methylase